MIKRCWLHSASFQPMNGQPVWVYHDGSKDVYGQQHAAGIYQSMFHWDSSVHSNTPHWWEIPLVGLGSLTGELYGNRLWQPRLDGEMPDPPPAEKPKPLDKPASPL